MIIDIRYVKLIFSLLLVFIISCNEIVKPESSEENEYKQNANSLAFNENIIHNYYGTETAYDLILSDDGYLYSFGLSDDNYFLKKTSTDGNLKWEKNFDNNIRIGCVQLLPETISNFSGLVLVAGGEDTDWDDIPDEAFIFLYSKDGALLDEYYLTMSEPCYFNTIKFKFLEPELFSFVIIGKIGIDTFYPIALNGIISNDEFQNISDPVMFSSLSNYSFNGIIDVIGSDSIFLKGNRFVGGIPDRIVIANLSNNLSIEWTKEIEAFNNKPTATYQGDGVYFENQIIVCGYSETNRESVTSYWTAGLICSLSLNGITNWVKTYDLSLYAEAYTSCFIEDNNLFLSGYYARYYWTSNDNCFGYGIITELNLSTLDIVSHLVLGNDKQRTGFNGVVFHEGIIYTVGYCNQEKLNSHSESYFASIFPIELKLKQPDIIYLIYTDKTNDLVLNMQNNKMNKVIQ